MGATSNDFREMAFDLDTLVKNEFNTGGKFPGVAVLDEIVCTGDADGVLKLWDVGNR